MSAIERRRRDQLQAFVDLCHRTGFELESFQIKIAGALLGSERAKLITLPRKNDKSRVIGSFAAWHLLTVPEAQVIVVANNRRGDVRSLAGTAVGEDRGAARHQVHRVRAVRRERG